MKGYVFGVEVCDGEGCVVGFVCGDELGPDDVGVAEYDLFVIVGEVLVWCVRVMV